MTMKRDANQDAGIHPVGPATRCWALAAGVPMLALALSWPGPAAGAASPPQPALDAAPAKGSVPKQDAGKTMLAQLAEERLGVEIRGVRLSAAGFMLDLRYRVLDAAKAAPLLDRKVHPYLLDQSGARFGVPFSPKIGALRSTRRGEILLDRDYSMLFGNPGRYLQQGSKITLVVGEQKIENLTVE
jgi:hypothetical protein